MRNTFKQVFGFHLLTCPDTMCNKIFLLASQRKISLVYMDSHNYVSRYSAWYQYHAGVDVQQQNLC